MCASFTLFGFPVRIDASFLVIAFMLAFGLPAREMLVWIGLVVGSVLVHELGHAFAARSFGSAASISLEGLTGLTFHQPLRRSQEAVVTVAGPAAGLLLGVIAVIASGQLDWPAWTLGGWALRQAVWINVVWSAFNLLPILPLDGGRLLELGLPGTTWERNLKAAQVSVVVAGLAAVAAYRSGLTYAALFAFLLAANNFARANAAA